MEPPPESTRIRRRVPIRRLVSLGVSRIDGGRLDPSAAETEDDSSPSAPRKQISVDHYRGDPDRGDPDPNCAPFPNDVPSRCTTDDSHSNNGRVQHLNHGAAPRPRGCAHRASESLCPAWLLPFQLHVGTLLYGRHRHAPAVLQQRTTALPPPPPPLLSFEFVDSRSSPLFCWRLWLPASSKHKLNRIVLDVSAQNC